MDNNTIALKIKQRLNKLASNDSINITCWQIVEAFNKEQVEWSRNNLIGHNIDRKGDEQSTGKIDDMQQLLKDTSVMPLADFDLYQETIGDIPKDYLRWKRFKAVASTPTCKIQRPLKVYLGTEGDLDILLGDKQKQPSFGWSETFAVMKNNKIQIYHNKQFTVDSLQLVYYREPIKIQIKDCKDPYTGTIPLVDVPCEFKDHIVEILIDGAAAILAGDIQDQFEYQRNNQGVDKNT